jgi:hypothetical protein
MLTLLLALQSPAAGSAQPLETPWTRAARSGQPRPEHPRPTQVRPRWLSLDGQWNYAVRQPGPEAPSNWDGEIRVPFPIESPLSGVGRAVAADRDLWLLARFEVPKEWLEPATRVLLHLDATSGPTRVWWNGAPLGQGDAGMPMSFDATALIARDAEQELLVEVSGGAEGGTGLWQPAWLEAVGDSYIADLDVEAVLGADAGRIALRARIAGSPREHLELRARVLGAALRGARESLALVEGRGPVDRALELTILGAHAWSPEEPWLYELEVELLDGGRGGALVDSLSTYAGLRAIGVADAADGAARFAINGAPRFVLALETRGWWPDGFASAPSDAAFGYDVTTARDLGFAALLVRGKLEAPRFYSWCDGAGMLVVQELETPEEADALDDHPSIVAWVRGERSALGPDEFALALGERADGRLVDADLADADLADAVPAGADSTDARPSPSAQPIRTWREHAGFELPVRGHVVDPALGARAPGLGHPKFLQEAWLDLLLDLRLARADSLGAAYVRSLADSATICDGMVTVDRQFMKVHAPALREAIADLERPAPELAVVLPWGTSDGAAWLSRTERDLGGPAIQADWFDPNCETAGWKRAPGPIAGWDSREIWVRRQFELPAGLDPALPRRMALELVLEGDCEVFLNGAFVRLVPQVPQEKGARSDGASARLRLLAEHDANLVPGRNTLALHATRGGASDRLDCALVELVDAGR